MKVIKGEEGCQESWQANFPTVISCDCEGIAHIDFVARETIGEKDEYICNNRPDNAHLWPHDAIAVAVYICGSCMKTTSMMNQG